MNWKERIFKYLNEIYGGTNLNKQTNSEIFRTMSDNKLAEVLADFTHHVTNHFPAWNDPYGKSYSYRQDAIDSWIKWLKDTIEE